MIRLSTSSLLTKSFRMPLVLYGHEASPPTTAVRMLGKLLGLEFEMRQVDLLSMQHRTSEFKKMNPMAVIPVLTDGDLVVSESHSILKYLLEKYGGEHREKLYPSDISVRSLIDTCMFFDTGVFFTRLKVVAYSTFLEGLPEPTARHLEDIDGAYAIVEDYLSRHRFVAADHITLADLSVASTAASMQAIKKIDPQRFPRCLEWLARLEQEDWFNGPMSTCVRTFTAVLEAFWKKNKKQ